MRHKDEGSVTVEAAFGLAGLTAMTVLLLVALLALTSQLRCTDAAHEAARLLARGQPDEAAAAVNRLGPPGANLAFEQIGDLITAKVTAHPPTGLLPAIHLDATAYAVAEPDTEVANVPG